MSFTIKRGPVAADNFTIISNALLRDATLSFKTRGLAAWMLTHRGDFALTMVRIAQLNGCGEASVRTAVKELEEAGYLVREQARQDGSGQFAETIYHLTDVPHPVADAIRALGGVSAGGDRRAVSHERVSHERETEVHKKTTSKKITGKNSDAAAPEGQESLDLGVATEPPVPAAPTPLTLNQRAVRLAQSHYERLGRMGNVPAMTKIIRKALEHDFLDDQVDRACAWIADRRWTLTEERLANALRGGPLPAGKTAPESTRPVYTTGNNGMEWE